MGNYIAFVISNFPALMTVLALILGFFGLFRRDNYPKAAIFLGFLFFFALGLSGIWGFVFHAFFPALAAHYIGWAPSPFQFEVAVANLGMGVVGLCGLHASKPYHIAGTLFTTCFLWGAAYGHVIQMLKANNFAPGNAGYIFYNDLILPILLIIFLLCWRRDTRLM